PDERFGQRVIALVASRDNGAGLADELREFVQGKIAAYKRPRAFLDVPTIPRLPNGKADYPAAKALAGQRLP
ncbi:MAG: acyl-CoA synthetase, partial [Burkholderiales bacterium]